jgi:hypothetical protein
MNRTVTVTELELWRDIPRGLWGFIAALNEAAQTIPAEYRDGAEIDAGSCWEYDEGYAHLRITYERPETPGETAARESAEQEDLNRHIEDARGYVARLEAQLGEKS